MSKTIPEVDTYLSGLAPERRAALARLRSLVFEVVPDAMETIKYRMPTYLHQDHVICSFASQKRYMSLYIDPATVDQHREELKGLDVGKSCIRFRSIDKLPLDTVRQMLNEVVESRSSL